jgi:hypothetical protein
MRLAWFSPLPPNRSGIAAYCADLLPLLSRRHEIDAFVDRQSQPPAPARPASDPSGMIPHPACSLADRVRVFDAHAFPGRAATRPYDLAVYQLGNDICHDYMWPYMVRHPGLVVMHDAQLHQARAKGLIWRQRRADTYRAEFQYCHPDAPSSVADLVVAGFGGTLYHLWPMLRVPVEAGRLVAVHQARVADDLRTQFPAARVTTIRMGVPDVSALPGSPPAEVRRRHGIPAGAVIFAAYGRVTPEKRIVPVIQALAGVISCWSARRRTTTMCWPRRVRSTWPIGSRSPAMSPTHNCPSIWPLPTSECAFGGPRPGRRPRHGSAASPRASRRSSRT